MTQVEEQLFEINLYTYRLNDGSYIIGEEINFDEEDCVLSMISPCRIIMHEGGIALCDWIVSDFNDITQVNTSNIISRTEAPMDLKFLYTKYIQHSMKRQEYKDQKIEDMFNGNQNDSSPIDKLFPNPYSGRMGWDPSNN